jgi:hypothetical protein
MWLSAIDFEAANVGRLHARYNEQQEEARPCAYPARPVSELGRAEHACKWMRNPAQAISKYDPAMA